MDTNKQVSETEEPSKVLVWPHKGLRVVAEPVPLEDIGTDRIRRVADTLRQTLLAYNAQGVAATQIGIPLRMLAYRETKSRAPLVLINPEITAKSDLIASSEGCLSFPGVIVRLKRASRVSLKAYTIYNDEIELHLTDMEAVAIQHELDHLNGVVMLDHLGKVARRMALKRLKKLKTRLGAYAP